MEKMWLSSNSNSSNSTLVEWFLYDQYICTCLCVYIYISYIYIYIYKMFKLQVSQNALNSCLYHLPEVKVSMSDTEKKKLLNKVIIFVFFAHKKYSRSFIKLTSNHWCHGLFWCPTFIGLVRGSSFAVSAGSESSQISSIYLNLCTKYE